MGKKQKRIIAIIALVFLAVFTVSFVVFLFDRTLLNGAIGFLALFSGGIGLALFLVIRLSRDNTDDIPGVNLSEDKPEEKDGDKTDEDKKDDEK